MPELARTPFAFASERDEEREPSPDGLQNGQWEEGPHGSPFFFLLGSTSSRE